MGDGGEAAGMIAALILLVFLAVIYFIPAIVASSRGHSQAGAIWVLNILLGWTLIGWVGALVWACTNSAPQQVVVTQPQTYAPPSPAAPRSAADQIAEFASLRDRGIISVEEFEAKKRQLLA